jgi:cardiolipin synthase
MAQYITTLSINYITIFAINLIFSAVIILLERKSPTTALAWLFFMTLFPGIGFFLYITLAQNISKRKIFRYTTEESRLYTSVLDIQKKALETDHFKFNDHDMKKYTDMILFHNKLSDSFYSQNNSIEIFTQGSDKFKSLFNDIKNAKHHIHILYYIVKNDGLGKSFLSLLASKASEGIEVRLLVDYVGGRHLRKKTIKMLKEAGVEIAFFFPSRVKYINMKANYRNHRKVVVIDGVIGYVGGINVGDEYLGLSKRFGFWRDTHLRIVGDAVLGLQMRFFLDWRSAAKKALQVSTAYIKESNSTGTAGVQIVSSGPDSINEQIKQGYIKMINKAKKYIYIQTPYFIPDESIMEALKIAVVSGVDVRIIIPNKPDHLFVYWASYSYVGELLQYGVKAYKYDNGFIHSKAIIVDDEISSVGTCNFDIRSFKLNFEVNAFIYEKNTTCNLKETFANDINDCTLISLEDYNNRSIIIKIKEAISRLFSPVL